VAFPVLAIVAAPVVAVVVHLRGIPNYGAQYRLVAQAVEKVWRESTNRPLRIVGSSTNLLYGTVFYFADRPSAFEIAGPQLTPWIDEMRIARDGIALYCPTEQNICMRVLNARVSTSAVSKREEIEISRSYLGMAGKPVRYLIVTIAPTM